MQPTKSIDLQKSNALVTQFERKLRNLERSLSEGKQKEHEMECGLESAQREARSLSAELFKTKNAYEEALNAVEVIKKENRNLSDELSDLSDQLSVSIDRVQNVEKERRAVDLERNEMHTALEEAEYAIEAEEAKARLIIENFLKFLEFAKILTLFFIPNFFLVSSLAT